MTRRRVLLLGSVAVVAALLIAAWAVWPRPSAINRENADKIEPGMTLAEVEAILGPARDESTGPTEAVELHARFYSGPFPTRWQSWKSDTIEIEVTGDEFSVWTVDRTPLRRQPQGVLDTLRRWLRL